MTRRNCAAMAACAAILVSAGLLAQENPFAEMTPEQQAEMQAWMKYSTPGKEHAMLASRAGTWTLAGKMWHAPNTEPETIEATSTIKSVMDGRYFIEKVEGPGLMGMPFEGRSVFGYDNLTKTYFVIWFDNMMTGVMRYEGTPSGDGTTIHYTVDVPDVMAGKYKQVRAVDKMSDHDSYSFVMYDTTADGHEFKSLEIVGTRMSGAKEAATTKKGY